MKLLKKERLDPYRNSFTAILEPHGCDEPCADSFRINFHKGSFYFDTVYGKVWFSSISGGEKVEIEANDETVLALEEILRRHRMEYH